uniref:SOGA 1/2-like coiled-coil domain-containing protein n=1 Tax=Amphilophus citrinellus TaxID=61819 RepID=A0A3Q0SMR3_AMPCI
MDLRSRLEHSERDWLREKAELLERFDVERREWENQLKDMQKKIEEVRCLQCENMSIFHLVCGGAGLDSGRRDVSDAVHRLSIRSTSTGSSLLSDNSRSEPLSSINNIHYLSSCHVCLFQALKEIARVSEELCSYQDEIKKKNGDKRENWITFSPGNTWQVKRGLSESCMTRNADPDGCRSTQTSHGVHSEMDTAAPPIPPRTSSWNLSAPTNPDTELHIPESPTSTVKKCHSPCALVDRKCSSPSIVRKFEAMLQENEGKVFVDGVVASCSVPANSNCNMACCHNRWSCDASKFTSSKLSTYGTVQKSFSEVNIRSARKNLCSDYSPGVENLKSAEAQAPPAVPVDLLLSPMSPNMQGSKRNLMLEQKTAEFNRTLFQAEMGRGVEEEEEDSFNETNTNSVGFQPLVTKSEVLPSKETTFEPHFTDATTSVMGVHPEVTLSLSDTDCAIQNPEVLPKSIRCATKAQEAGIKQETPSVLSPAQPQAVIREAPIPSHSPAHQCEVKHKVRTTSSPSRKTQHRAATEALFSEPVLPANTQPVDDSSSKKENPHGAKAQPARAAVSLQQLSAENKQRQTAQPRHVSGPPCQSDSSRPGPRIMNDHPWKPLTLAAYPRPEGSRSNYGAVERILKNYESAARVQQNQQNEMHSNSNPFFSVAQEKNATELDMLNVNPLPLPLTLRQTQSALSLQTHPSHAQLSSHGASGVKEIQLVVQVGGA